MDIDLIITKFLLGEISEEEKQELKDWISQDAGNKKHFVEIKRLFNVLEIINNVDEIDPETAWDVINDKLLQKSGSNVVHLMHKGIGKPLFRLKKFIVAAMLLLTIGISFGSAYLFFNKKYNATITCNEINVPKGSKTYLTLNDGSKIWLNSMSKLTYPGKFNTTYREVFLEGEAYFKIAKDKNIPFYVRTSDLDIKVLGTSFNIKSYKNEGTIEATLESGSISIFRKGQDGKTKHIVLKPDQRLTFVKSEGRILVDNIKKMLKNDKYADTAQTNSRRKEKLYLAENINTKLYTAWKDNKLIFVNESFESLAVRMERWYNVRIEITGDKLKQYRFTGTFEKETIEQALKALQITTKFEYSIDHNKITIKYNNRMHNIPAKKP